MESFVQILASQVGTLLRYAPQRAPLPFRTETEEFALLEKNLFGFCANRNITSRWTENLPLQLTTRYIKKWAESAIFQMYSSHLSFVSGDRYSLRNAHLFIYRERYQQGEEKDSDTENDRENGLRMKKEMTMKEKRFSFFADPQERKAESRPTLHTFANHTSQPANLNLQKSAILQTLKK